MLLYTVYPKKYAHGFVVLCFVVVMESFRMNSHEVFIHIHQGCFAGTGAIVSLMDMGKSVNVQPQQSTAKQKPCAYFFGYTVWLGRCSMYFSTFSSIYIYVGVAVYFNAALKISNKLWMAVTYQIYSLVLAIYDLFTLLHRSVVCSSYIAGTRSYIWYVAVNHNEFTIYIYN